MSTHLAQLTLTFHEHLQQIAAAPTRPAKKAAEANFAAFLRSTLAEVEAQTRERKRRYAGRDDEA